jgi:hypothetical protein
MTAAPPLHPTATLFVLLAVVATGTLVYNALMGDLLRVLVACSAAVAALGAALAFERRWRKAAVFAGGALGLQVLSLALAFGGDSIAVLLANVLASVAGILAVVDRLVELPADWSRTHA